MHSTMTKKIVLSNVLISGIIVALRLLSICLFHRLTVIQAITRFNDRVWVYVCSFTERSQV